MPVANVVTTTKINSLTEAAPVLMVALPSSLASRTTGPTTRRRRSARKRPAPPLPRRHAAPGSWSRSPPRSPRGRPDEGAPRGNGRPPHPLAGTPLQAHGRAPLLARLADDRTKALRAKTAGHSTRSSARRSKLMVALPSSLTSRTTGRRRSARKRPATPLARRHAAPSRSAGRDRREGAEDEGRRRGTRILVSDAARAEVTGAALARLERDRRLRALGRRGRRGLGRGGQPLRPRGLVGRDRRNQRVDHRLVPLDGLS